MGFVPKWNSTSKEYPIESKGKFAGFAIEFKWFAARGAYLKIIHSRLFTDAAPARAPGMLFRDGGEFKPARNRRNCGESAERTRRGIQV
jgi:hypothetical protein